MKIKRKALSILSCFTLLVSSIPSTTVFVSAEDYTSATTEPVFEKVGSSHSPCVFANGTPITVKTEDGKVVVEYSFGGQTKKLDTKGEDIPENVTIFGGNHNQEGTLQSSEVIIDGVKVHGVFGGGLHKSHVETATVTVKGNADLDFVQGGGASSYKGLVDDCQWYSGDKDNATTKVDDATVKIEGDGCDIGTVFGGGEGISYTGTTSVTIEGGTISTVSAGGSNGYTGSATVNISAGNITTVQSVNRGTMDSAQIDVTGGTITNLYIGGETEDSGVTGTITGATVNVTGGKVEHLYLGTSGGLDVDVRDSKNFSVVVSSEAEVGLDEALQDSEILTCEHNLEHVEGTPASCTDTGTKDSWKCKNCQKLFADENAAKEIQQAETIDALGHKWSDWKAIDKNSNKSGEYTPVTCTEDGWQYIECSQCGAEEYREVKAKGRHTFPDDKPENGKDNPDFKVATCTEGGTYRLKCEICGELSDIIKTDPLGHDMEKVAAKASTCKDPGTKAHYQCSVCTNLFVKDGDVYTQVTEDQLVIPETNHQTKVKQKNAKEAECEAVGQQEYYKCQYCDTYFFNTGTDEEPVYVEVQAGVDGYEDRDQSNTVTEYDFIIPKLGHDWDWTLQVTKEPTCIAGGEGEITCKRCDEKEIVIIDKNPSAHKYKNDGICQLCGQKVLTQSGSNVTSKKATNKNNEKNAKIVKIINSRNKTKVKIKKKKIIIKFSRRGGCKYRIKIYNKKNKEISLKVKQDYMKGNGKKKFKKFYQIKKKGNYRIEIYELKGMKEKNFKDVKCIYLNYKTIK